MKNIENTINLILAKKRVAKIIKNNHISFISSILCLVVFLMIISYIYSWYSYKSYPEIDYSRLNQETKEYAEKLVNSVNPEYLEITRRIMFTEDPESLNCNKKLKNTIYKAYGENSVARKYVKVYLTGNFGFDLNSLCHELLHSFILTSSDEKIIEDMLNKAVCIKNKPKIEIELKKSGNQDGVD